MSNTISIISALVAVAALGVSVLSWRAAERSARATIYEERYRIFEDADRFIATWSILGRPDLDLLPPLVRAWNRSHFLCRPEVTEYLHKLHMAAIAAHQNGRIADGLVPGKQAEALENLRRWVAGEPLIGVVDIAKGY